MVLVHKRSQFWTNLPIFILLMTCVSIVTMSDDADDFNALFDETQQGSVFYLDNGMEVILVENHANPMIAAFTIVKTGSRNEDAATNGAAHFLEHLLFNGTKPFSTDLFRWHALRTPCAWDGFYHITSPARAGLGILSDVVCAEQHNADGYRRFFDAANLRGVAAG